MGRNSTVDQLPSETFAELRRRLIASKFSLYEDHAAWLSEKGYTVSKSSLHRYGQALEEELRATSDLRMRCLEVASRLPSNDREVLVSTAEYLVEWVRSGRR